jgi:aminopeptidase YwaD
MKKSFMIMLGMIVAFGFMFAQMIQPPPPQTLLPLSVLQDIINETSGDLALQNEIFLTAVNRNRLPQEYANTYFEVDFIMKKLKEYGIEKVEVIELPTRSKTTWDAEMAELWITQPELKKIADLNEVAASLCSGSVSTDTTAELVYIGPGNKESYYQGKEVKDKIVLVNGPPEMARRLAVEKFGAVGLVGYSSSHPEFDPDEVGWNGLRASETEKPTFGFMVSTRQGQELRDQLERGMKVEVRAVAKTTLVPYKEQMVAALLPGKDEPEEELVFTAHLFEGFAKQGANDDASGCVAILETARTIKKLVDTGKVPPLRRSIRFLFVPEISGTAAYIKKYPDTAKRFFANINEDMVGEALIKNRSFFNLERSPHSLPSYLSDVLESIVGWVGATQKISEDNYINLPDIISPTGTREAFYFAFTSFTGGSDHIVFLDGGVRVPACMFICWPDMWYHTSGDTPDKSDSTQLKRVAFISTAAAVFLANAGPEETQKMIAETSARGLARLGMEKLRAEKRIMEADAKGIHDAYKEALNIIDQAVTREKEALSTIRFFIRGATVLESHLGPRIRGVENLRIPFGREVEETYDLACIREKVKPQKPSLSQDEIRLSKLIPVRTAKMQGYFDARDFYQKVREMKEMPPFQLGRADYEVRNFINGKRSVLDIRNAVSAEYGPLPLKSVEGYILLLEKTGFVKIQNTSA